MEDLNITNVRGYSMFMALSSHHQVPWKQALNDRWTQLLQNLKKFPTHPQSQSSGCRSVGGLGEIPQGLRWQTTQ